MQIISKIWILGGWFYLSLLCLVILFYFGKKELRKKVDLVVLVWAAILVLYVAVKSITGNLSQVVGFWLPIDKKLNVETNGQVAYAAHLKNILPKNAHGCLYFSLDMETWYLQNQLYPRMFNVITDNEDVNNCGLLISQFRPRTNPMLEEIDNFNGNYLYKVKSNVY